MKPIPPEILAMHPSHPDTPIPERPWWWRAGLNALAWRDGIGVVHSAEQAEAMDASRPMPHPGFRVGQVWVWSDHGTVEAATVVHWDSGGGMATLQAWGATFTISAGAGVFLPDASMPIGRRAVPAWLLADPCCPWLAPWGPA